MDDPTAYGPEQPLQEQLVVFAKEFGDLYRSQRLHSDELKRALRELEETHASTIQTLASLVEVREPSKEGGHLERLRDLAMELTRQVEPELADAADLSAGFLLHDIGVMGIPEQILAKEGPLTDEEWFEMRRHPLLGAELVRPMTFLGDAAQVIMYHHERFDGTGYPSGLNGELIPLPARIFSVVDAFDAMTSDRPYRRAMAEGEAFEELTRGRGSQFDPGVVDAFLRLTKDGSPAPAAAVGSAKGSSGTGSPVRATRI
ncbi:MAG: HD domain-containing phosphohydrolase [Actinomycetota bacterium]